MPQRREHPYIWATWLPRLLTGENSCEWAVWFKAHHRDWTRQPSDFDQAQWLLDHAALVNERIRNWEVGGFDVEAQNRFELRCRTATLAGRLDTIARREDGAVIVDAKTGQECPSHAVQVMIYLYAAHKTVQAVSLIEEACLAVLIEHLAVGDGREGLPAEDIAERIGLSAWLSPRVSNAVV